MKNYEYKKRFIDTSHPKYFQDKVESSLKRFMALIKRTPVKFVRFRKLRVERKLYNPH